MPPYIKRCKNDKSLNDCILKNSKEAINGLIKGDSKLGIPVLEPLKVDKIEHSTSASRSVSLNFTLSQVNIYGIPKTELVKSELDTSKKIIKLNFKIPQLVIKSNYHLNGKFLVVPVVGNGKLTLTIDNLFVTFSTNYNIVKKKGTEYIDLILPAKLSYTTTKVSPVFENLFNGDKNLGDNFNKVVNENWREWDAHVGPGIADALGQVIASILKRATSTVPYNEIFL
ncbi:protein takeout [Halyomorpha halys]|uniref:protein takeout n=1 Tax=Halyomorpha halys TaxID=286706 RepID=UPI0034D379E3